MGFVAVGGGCAFEIHCPKFKNQGITCAGVLETNPEKQKELESRGFKIYKSYEEASQTKPLFWDVCVPTGEHVNVVEKIIKLDPEACILVEKPVCDFQEIDRLKELQKNFKGKIFVNENYLTSEVTKQIKSIVEKFKLEITKIHIEMDKNRTLDLIEKNRFTDRNGAFYIEGPHMITILKELFKSHMPTGKIRKKYEDFKLDDKTLPNQGSADVAYEANGVSISLFTSMKGDIKAPYPPINLTEIPVKERHTRYRVAAVEGVSSTKETLSVVGFYEPVKGQDRSQGFVCVIKDGQMIEKTETIYDDTMGSSLKNAADYFKGTISTNPSSVEEAIRIVETMNTITT